MNLQPLKDSPQGREKYWHKNLEALRRRNTALARQLEELPPSPRCISARAEDGSPILAIVLDNGQTAALCHTGQPRQEAEQWVMGLGEDLRRNAHVLLMGFGSGHHPQAFFRLSDADTVLWIVEPDAALFKAALCGMDFTSMILSPRVHWAVGISETEVVQRLFSEAGGNRMRVQGIRMAFTAASRYLYGDFIQRLGAAIQESIQMEGLKFRTSELQGETILRNAMANLPWILRGAPWKRLLGRAPGVPALIVAPGPSLEAALPHLAAVRKRAIFLAIDTAHRILHQHGIVSDLVVSLDFTELNARHFETIGEDRAILLAFPGVDPSIPARYAGRTFFCNHSGTADFGPGATPVLKALHSLNGLGDLVSYGSTAHLAVHAARQMGCSPIILVGNDLAFPGERWYAEGAMQNELDQPERQKEPLLPVPANDGTMVPTSGLYKYYLNTFGDLIRGSAAPVVNTSPKGARIEGARWMDLCECLNAYCTAPVDVSFLENALHPSLAVYRMALIEELRHYTETFARARRLLHRLSKRLASLHPASAGFRMGMIQIMKDFSDALRSETAAFDLCTALCARSTLALLGQSGQSGLLGGGDEKTNRESLDRCSDLFRDMQNALQKYRELTNEAISRLSGVKTID